MPIVTLLLVGFIIFNLWRHIKRECERDKKHAKAHGHNTSIRDNYKRPR